MRKVIITIMLISLVFGLSGCTTKHLTIKQSQKNFLVYQESLQRITEQYGLSLIANEINYFENQNSYKDFTVTVSSNSVIEILLTNSALESEKGVENCSIYYRISNISSVNDYNIPLFVDIVNSVSGKSISVDFCAEFLNAPESKYSAEKRYGYRKLNGEIIAKEKPLNFFADWNISYILKSNEGELGFGGLTKQLSE